VTEHGSATDVRVFLAALPGVTLAGAQLKTLSKGLAGALNQLRYAGLQKVVPSDYCIQDAALTRSVSFGGVSSVPASRAEMDATCSDPHSHFSKLQQQLLSEARERSGAPLAAQAVEAVVVAVRGGGSAQGAAAKGEPPRKRARLCYDTQGRPSPRRGAA
jgi:hypothetical protein